MNRWRYATTAWVGVIFFSSTTLASRWCEGAFAWLATVLFGGEAIHQPSFVPWHFLADKGLHVTLFFVLALLLWRAVPRGRFKPLAILTLGLFVGSCSEFLQRFFPGRDPAIRDVLINLGGTALGLTFCLLVGRWAQPALLRPTS